MTNKESSLSPTEDSRPSAEGNMIAIKTRLSPDGSFPITFWMVANELILSFEFEEDPRVVTQSARHDKRGIEVTYAFHPEQRDLAMLFKLTFGSA